MLIFSSIEIGHYQSEPLEVIVIPESYTVDIIDRSSKIIPDSYTDQYYYKQPLNNTY